MKKIVLYIFLFVLVCSTIPVIFTNKPQKDDTPALATEDNNKIEQETIEPYKTKEYSTVKLLHNSTGEVETISMEDYLLRSCFSRDACKF